MDRLPDPLHHAPFFIFIITAEQNRRRLAGIFRIGIFRGLSFAQLPAAGPSLTAVIADDVEIMEADRAVRILVGERQESRVELVPIRDRLVERRVLDPEWIGIILDDFFRAAYECPDPVMRGREAHRARALTPAIHN